MENAAKALLIAAGVLVGIIVISLIIVSYRQISTYYTEKEEAKEIEQLSNFNAQYVAYYRDDVRGSDLLSLINKIIDFNTLNDADENDADENDADENDADEPINISINISIKIPTDRHDNAKLFYYNYSTYNNIKLITLGKTYTEKTINEILDTANAIESTYTQGIATKLAANMSTLMRENTRKSPEELLEELKIKATEDEIPNIQNDILKYYQYNQFKRAHFDCKELSYDKR